MGSQSAYAQLELHTQSILKLRIKPNSIVEFMMHKLRSSQPVEASIYSSEVKPSISIQKNSSGDI
jgi:hypothetical protein